MCGAGDVFDVFDVFDVVHDIIVSYVSDILITYLTENELAENDKIQQIVKRGSSRLIKTECEKRKNGRVKGKKAIDVKE